MEFIVGATVFLSSMLLLAILARISAANPDAAVLRGEITPALLAVLVTSGLIAGFLMMVVGGEGHFASPNIELLTIFGITIAAIWVITRFVVRTPGTRSA